jgi:L-threonylcarbamoyladenylate synthase
VERIYAAKGRDANDPLIVHLPAADRLPEVARDLPPVVDLLGASFWPGPLTLVVPKSPRVPPAVTAGLPTVAVRVPAHPVAQGLLEACGVPLAAPSANTFTRTSATTAAHVQEDLGQRVDLILDGGPAPLGIESTVLQVHRDGTLRLLRPGAVTLEALDEVLTRAGRPPVVRPALQSSPGETVPGPAPGAAPGTTGSGPAPGPGMLLKHYAPRARMRFFRGPPAAAREALLGAAREALARGERVGLLLYREDTPHAAGLEEGAGERVRTEDLGPAGDAAGVGRRLFAAMRRLDATGVDTILARSLPAGGLGLAIDDRLTRAAGGEVVQVGGPDAPAEGAGPVEAHAGEGEDAQDAGEVQIVRLPPESWREYRALRLRALQDAPAAFGSTYAGSLTHPDSTWIERLQAAAGEESAWLRFARLRRGADREVLGEADLGEGTLVGMMGAFLDESDPSGQTAFVVGVFVAPEARGRGVGRRLLESILGALRATGCTWTSPPPRPRRCASTAGPGSERRGASSA